MEEHYEIENIEQLRAVADVLRLRIIDILREQPMTVTQLGEKLGMAPAKVHYHVRELERVGLLKLVETREKGGILEKYYQPIARVIGVERTLLSAPPDESIATLGALLSQVRENFLSAFQQVMERREENPMLSLGFTRLYLTPDELKSVLKHIEELAKPFEQPRGVEGEREVVASLLVYPEAQTERPSLAAPTPTVSMAQVVGTMHISRAELEKALAEGRRLNVTVVGICQFADDIPAELAERAIERIHVIGKLFAPPAIREALLKKEGRQDKRDRRPR